MTDEDLDFSFFAAQCQLLSSSSLVWMHGQETDQRRRAAIRRILAERKYAENQIQSIAHTVDEFNQGDKP